MNSNSLSNYATIPADRKTKEISRRRRTAVFVVSLRPELRLFDAIILSGALTIRPLLQPLPPNPVRQQRQRPPPLQQELATLRQRLPVRPLTVATVTRTTNAPQSEEQRRRSIIIATTRESCGHFADG